MENTEITEQLKNEMKKSINDRASCMLDSYTTILAKTKDEIYDTIGYDIEPAEILKRTDMFFNLALQRMDREIAEIKQDKIAKEAREAQELRQEQAMNMPTMPIMPEGMPPGSFPESPCAKKAREAAEKITVLEAEIKDGKTSE